jgi:hypothetical protein
MAINIMNQLLVGVGIAQVVSGENFCVRIAIKYMLTAEA